MKKLLIFTLGTLLSGCTCYNYVASPKYVPLIKDAGELRLNLYPSNAQLGYSITKNVGLFGGWHQRAVEEDGTAIFVGEYDRYADFKSTTDWQADFGGTYSVSDKYFIYEVVAGGGLGRSSYKRSSGPGLSGYNFEYKNAQTNNFFIQPNVGFRHKHLSVGVFTKFVRYRFTDLAATALWGSDGSEASPRGEDVYFMDRKSISLTFAEPGVQFSGGFKYLHGQVQVSTTHNFSAERILIKQLNVNIAISLRLNTREPWLGIE